MNDLQALQVWLTSPKGVAYATWAQAVGSVIAIVGAFLVAKWQFQRELKKEHDRSAEEDREQIAQLYAFIRQTFVDVRALWDDPKKPGFLEGHWKDSSVRFELARAEAALSRLQTIPVTQLPKMENGVRSCNELIASLIAAKLVLIEHLDEPVTLELQQRISEKMRPAALNATRALMGAFIDSKNATKSRGKRQRPQGPHDPAGATAQAFDENRQAFEAEMKARGMSVKQMLSRNSWILHYDDPVTWELWDLWMASRSAAERKGKVASEVGAPSSG
ncbi:hypothetical protein [Variovorax sp. JS1663]|uniref:hypothetical protein n=1 Tax=Variovorax sp. JS1663 TaxID=1851577 RepID=UPI000B346912|nr:hypothetical protein [Variovorax sp. JS1663]OUM00098.1 hypothetical protein A8M77_23235 [Variovorax sp. JS1663]